MQTQNDPINEPAYGSIPPVLPPSAPRPAQPAVRRDYFDDPRRKSPVLALMLSFMPGLGQIYVGYYQQGFTYALVIASTIALLSADVLPHLEPLLGIFLAFFWLFNVVDAWRRAVFYNNALAGIGEAALPEEFGVPKLGGSLGGGLALVVIGGVLLSNTLLGWSLYWLESWWPMAFIIVGAWLAYPAIKAKLAGPQQGEPRP